MISYVNFNGCYNNYFTYKIIDNMFSNKNLEISTTDFLIGYLISMVIIFLFIIFYNS